jgi:hypothetical protein
MALFKIGKKFNDQISNKNFEIFSEWLNKILDIGLPDSIIALNFNLYEGAEQTYDIQLIGSDEFDENDSDWACNEIFTTGENLCYISRTNDIANWENGFVAIKEIINEYLTKGKYANYLKNFKAIGAGFVDGDLEILHIKN